MNRMLLNTRKCAGAVISTCLVFLPAVAAFAADGPSILPLDPGATGSYAGQKLTEIRETYQVPSLAKPDFTIDEVLDANHRITSLSVTQGKETDTAHITITKKFDYGTSNDPYGYVDISFVDSQVAKSLPAAAGSAAAGLQPMWIDLDSSDPIEGMMPVCSSGGPISIATRSILQIFNSSPQLGNLPQSPSQDVLCYQDKLYPLSDPTISLTSPATLGNGIPFSILSSQGSLIGVGTYPAIPGGQLQMNTFTPPPPQPNFWLPNIGQAGKLVTVIGPFSGDLNDTHVVFNSDPVPVLAETNNCATFKLPSTIFGTTDLSIDDGLNHIKYKYTSLGLNLIGYGQPLQPQESGDFSVKVLGLSSLINPATVHIDDLNPEVATMAGGNSQSFTIAPADGTDVTKSYTLTGVKRGACNVVAYVPQQWSDEPYAGIGDHTVAAAPAGGPANGPGVPPVQQAAVPPPDNPNNANTPDQPTKPITTDGWFEPVQGVWQDDDNFKDKATKQLTKLGAASWNAELRMVQGRPTKLFGIRDDKHENIVIKGGTFGTVPVDVRFRFTLYENGQPPYVLYTESVSHNKLWIDGPKGKPADFNAVLPAHDGVPTEGRNPFTFKSTGPYRIVAELIRPDDSPTGVSVTVAGETVKTVGPKVYFIPAIVNEPKAGGAAAESADLHKKAKDLASECAKNIPLWFPLTPDGFHTDVLDTRDFTSFWHIRLAHKVAAQLAQQWSELSYLEGSSRVVLVMDKDNFNACGGDGAVAFTETQKVIFCRSDQAEDTVAHEYIHTTPFLWSSAQMIDEFGFSYHNGADKDYAEGAEIQSNGFVWRQNSKHAIMGASSAIPLEWITQGTYWHLIDEFTAPHDPPIVTITGTISNEGGRFTGSLGSLYDQDGAVDLTPGPRTDWAIVLKGWQGNIIYTYPFNAQWALPDLPAPCSDIAIAYRVPNLHDTAEIDLVSPNGVVAKRIIGSQPPVVSIASPANNGSISSVNGKITVSWTAADPAGGKLLYTVLYSPNGGADWYPEAFEQTQNTAVIPLENGHKAPQIRVIATNGGKSGEALVKFTIKN